MKKKLSKTQAMALAASKHESVPSPEPSPRIERLHELESRLGVLRCVEPGDDGYLIAVLDAVCFHCGGPMMVLAEVPAELGPKLETLKGQKTGIGLLGKKYRAARCSI